MKTAGRNQHPHENDNKDGGPWFAADAEQHMSDEHASMIDELRREIEIRDIDSLSELQVAANRSLSSAESASA